jgi:hypothetical protein
LAAVLLLSVWVLGACVPDPEGEARDTFPTLTPSPAPAETTPPTAAPQPTITFAPFSFPPTASPRVLCPNTPPTRLILGERARVSDDDPTDLNVRASPNTNANNRPIGKLRMGEVVVVVSGPACANGYTWYEISGATLSGWIAEGEDALYYVEPFLGE